VSVDFVAFRDADGNPRLWAVDLNIGVHDTVVSYELFRFLTGGHFNPNLGTYYAGTRNMGHIWDMCVCVCVCVCVCGEEVEGGAGAEAIRCYSFLKRHTNFTQLFFSKRHTNLGGGNQLLLRVASHVLCIYIYMSLDGDYICVQYGYSVSRLTYCVSNVFLMCC